MGRPAKCSNHDSFHYPSSGDDDECGARVGSTARNINSWSFIYYHYIVRPWVALCATSSQFCCTVHLIMLSRQLILVPCDMWHGNERLPMKKEPLLGTYENIYINTELHCNNLLNLHFNRHKWFSKITICRERTYGWFLHGIGDKVIWPYMVHWSDNETNKQTRVFITLQECNRDYMEWWNRTRRFSFEYRIYCIRQLTTLYNSVTQTWQALNRVGE